MLKFPKMEMKSILLLPFIFFAGFVLGGVEIVNPYHPWYVLAGTPLTVVCQSQTSATISWSQQTPKTSWTSKTVVATPGQDFIIQNCYTSGLSSAFTRSTLTRTNMSLNTRGTYICQDDISSYEVYVTVLYIEPSRPVLKEDSIVLTCTVSGFETNLPSMDYDWLFNGSLIPHPHDHLTEAAAVHSPDVLDVNSKYNVSLDDGVLTLTILRPGAEDSGVYNCSYTLPTNLGSVTFSQPIFVDASSFKARMNGASSCGVSTLLSCVLFVLMVVFMRVR